MKGKLRYFPITAYAIVMGLAGLSIVFAKFHHMQWLPKIFYEIMLFSTLFVFLGISVLYALKAIRHFEEVKIDFNHRIRINFFSAFSISILLLSIAFMSYWPFLSMSFWWIGTIVHTALMLYTVAYWIQNNFEIQFMNPAWFIPIVGNMLIPIAGVEYLPKLFSFFYFGVGFFFWIILFTIFLNRAIFHHQLPQKFVPTLFILIAPPAIGFIAYIRIAQSWDTFAVFLLLISYFFAVLLLVLHKSFKKLEFFISWWAFTFPLMAITIASVVAFQISHQAIFKYLSFFFMAIAVLTISFVAYKTVGKIRQGEICINEE
ncbi:C4-dicarboxylate ABC transporter [Labilibaculum filiforme]|uniref:C4-dicarboxylate ABC transporter n=1 Tax=Labilibaculum filiforme TaxID=1940526 RepID=A0A2N3HZI2_9BACT|nr:SLAC1 anion channel family protein [Labilibaculum filiforme]PKQ63403.1 C4-dicarboxylate ABC transporter [Labilibaculum filiforme]